MKKVVVYFVPMVAILVHSYTTHRVLMQSRRSGVTPPPPPTAKASIQAPSCRRPPTIYNISFTLVRRDDWEPDLALTTMGEALRIRNFVTTISTCGETTFEAASQYIRRYWSADFITCIHSTPTGLPCTRAYLLMPPSLVTPTFIAMGSPEGQVPRCCMGNQVSP